ncbi:MAG: hypothetical protein Q9182_000976 [Xanthomendoza sp. 2 TL-2023]
MASTPASRLLSKEKLAGWVPHFQDLSKHVTRFNTLTASVQYLRNELNSGRLQSTEIVEEYQRSICIYNHWLGAIYQLSPGALDRARELDSMRKNGKILGPLHGIPILLKDSIATPKALGLGNTGGAVALIGSEPHGAVIVDKNGPLTCTGAKIFDADGLPPPASLSLHMYAVDSTGATALEATAAGLAPIAVGVETDGSLVTPSTRASLYTVKPTHGLVDTANIIPISARYDTAGPMGKTVKDVADLLDVLVDPSKTDIPHGNYASAMTTSWDDVKVGTLDPEQWRMDDTFVKPVPEATKMIVCSSNLKVLL